MLHYPKIPGSASAPNDRCIAFDKLDGTNLHWCWEREFGWHAFGTRRDEFNLTADGITQFNAAHPGLEEALRRYSSRRSRSRWKLFCSNTHTTRNSSL